MNIKALSLTLLLSALQLTALTDVKSITINPIVEYKPGKAEITINLPEGMNKHKFEVIVTEDGTSVTVKGCSKTIKPEYQQKYRNILAKTIVLEGCHVDQSIASQSFSYNDRKKAALKSVLIQKYVENTLHISLPTNTIEN